MAITYDVIELKKGVNDPLVISTPTRIVGTGWDCEIACDSRQVCIDCRAPTIAEGFRMYGGKYCVDVQSGIMFRGSNLWVHHSQCSGIHGEAGSRMVIDHVLCEYNGKNPNFDHGVYHTSHLVARNCIFRNNSGWQLHGYNNADQSMVSGQISESLVIGNSAVVSRGPVWFRKCTIVGKLSVFDQAIDFSPDTLYLDKPVDGVFLDVPRGLYMPLSPDEKRGCYPYKAEATVEWAKTKWNGGVMYSFAEQPFRPWFPGDTIPA